MPEFKTLSVSTDGPVGRLVLARPDRLNALSPDTLRELAQAARWLNRQPALKVVTVAGEGRCFCAGFDLDDAAGRTKVDGEVVDLGRLMAEAIDDIRAITIARIHGHCVGGGLVLAAACDLRVAAASARFSIPELDLGIPLAWGGIPRLVRELGPAVAKELVLTCRPFTAAEAHALRFLNRVVPDEQLDAEVQWFVDRLVGKSAYTLLATKRQVNAVAEQAGSTRESFRDAQTTVGAFYDEESIAVMKRYLKAQGR